MTQSWLATVSAVPREDFDCSEVFTCLLNMALDPMLLPHIPVHAWDWLKNRAPLQNGWHFRSEAGTEVVRTLRKLGDVELVTSCLFIFWSGADSLPHLESQEITNFIREDLGGIEAAVYRADLIRQLHNLVPQLWGSEGQQHTRFRKVLLEVDEEAIKTLTGTSCRVATLFLLTCTCAGYHSTFMCALPLPCP